MTDARVVNLNKARKARAKTQARAEADQNAARFGRTKAQRDAEKAAADKAARALDAHRRAPAPAPDPVSAPDRGRDPQ